MENSRQSAAESRRTNVISVARCFVHDLSGIAAVLVSVCFSDNSVSGLPSRRDGPADPSPRNSLDQSLLESLGRLPHQHVTGRALVRLPAASGLSDVRCNRPHTLQKTILAKATPRMGLSG